MSCQVSFSPRFPSCVLPHSSLPHTSPFPWVLMSFSLVSSLFPFVIRFTWIFSSSFLLLSLSLLCLSSLLISSLFLECWFPSLPSLFFPFFSSLYMSCQASLFPRFPLCVLTSFLTSSLFSFSLPSCSFSSLVSRAVLHFTYPRSSPPLPFTLFSSLIFFISSFSFVSFPLLSSRTCHFFSFFSSSALSSFIHSSSLLPSRFIASHCFPPLPFPHFSFIFLYLSFFTSSHYPLLSLFSYSLFRTPFSFLFSFSFCLLISTLCIFVLGHFSSIYLLFTCSPVHSLSSSVSLPSSHSFERRARTQMASPLLQTSNVTKKMREKEGQ